LIAALPLYEDLHKHQPESNVWRERLGMCLIGSIGTDAERAANIVRAHQLFLDAKAAGDNSNLLQTVLEKLEAPAAPSPTGPPSPGLAAFRQAESAFKNGDLLTALKFYQQAAEADPKLYKAPLYARDTEFKQGHYAEADKWCRAAHREILHALRHSPQLVSHRVRGRAAHLPVPPHAKLKFFRTLRALPRSM
jgi:tetratricopeptide (TPR) repeat protein